MFRFLFEALLWTALEGAAHSVARAILRATVGSPNSEGIIKSGVEHPVYKANLERLIEHHRQFEKKE
jgi:hypothetical protein